MNNPSIYRWTDIFRITGIAAVYILLAVATMCGFDQTDLLAPIWPPSGFALAVLLLWGARLWPAIALGSFLANFLVGKSISVIITFTLGNTIEPLAAIWFLNWYFKDSVNSEIIYLRRTSDYRQLGLAAIIAVSVSSLFTVFAFFCFGELQSTMLPGKVIYMWITNLSGIVIMTPFMLTWRTLPQGWFRRSRAFESLSFLTLAFVVGQIIFLGWFSDIFGTIARGYWVLIFIAWGAVRYGRHGTLLMLTIISIQSIVGASRGIGFFGEDIRESGLINMQLSLILVSNIGLLLALVIRELKQSQTEMQLAALVYQTSNEGMMVTDAQDCIISVNPAFTDITGYQYEEVAGTHPTEQNSDLHDQNCVHTIWQTIDDSGRWRGEITNRRKNGETFTEMLNVNSVYNQDGSLRCRVSLFSDISELKKNEETIWKQANYDALTDLPNRWWLTRYLEDELGNCKNQTHRLALILIDLDDFKAINEAHSHAFGDQLLKETAVRLRQSLPDICRIGRLGGDEFVVTLSRRHDKYDVERLVNRIIDTLKHPFQIENKTIYATASMGIAEYPRDAESIDTLLKRADLAMYAAKKDGRNRFCCYSPAMQAAVDERMRLAHDLRLAIAEQQLRVHYQPIVDLATGNIHKAEALVRWLHPKLGLISPAIFIPIAEETGLIAEIGDWVFKQAVAQAKFLINFVNRDFQISVNKSPVQFKSMPDTCSQWLDYLKKFGLLGRNIVLEITEGLLMEAKDDIVHHLLTARDNGMQVALDDFGTGYSSLAYLKKFDIDYIKIDQSFVRNLHKDSNDFALCETMVVMAHKLGLMVIAEGIETAEQLALLREIGCDYGQGCLFSKPVPADDFNKLVRNSMTTKADSFTV